MGTTIYRNEIDTNRDGRIDKEEWEKFVRSKDDGDYQVVREDGTPTDSGKLATLMNGLVDSTIAGNGETKVPAEQQMTTVKGYMDQLMTALREAKLANNNQEITKIQSQIAELVSEAERLQENVKPQNKMNLASYKEAAGLKEGRTNSPRAQAMAGRSGSPDTSGMQPKSARAQAGSNAATGSGTSGANYVPKAFTADTGWGDLASKYNDALAVSSDIQEKWSAIGTTTAQGKKLMQLFFYFMKMAESGDMGAMYQFMKFITFIVSKDKAKQQIEMGKKLIQLQELSRKWTDKLLNLQSDNADASTSSELMKTMTIVKSETDAIATSQKLISQMMEEFSQVVETLTNVTKSALETDGRIKRAVSTIR